LALAALPRFDPSFVALPMAASVEAIFLSTFVLISQNRMAAAADKRAGQRSPAGAGPRSDPDVYFPLAASHPPIFPS
jgi:hypothetical protein